MDGQGDSNSIIIGYAGASDEDIESLKKIFAEAKV